MPGRSARVGPDARAPPSTSRPPPQRVDGNFIRANAAKTPDWPSYGLDYAETRFSKLDQVNAGNVKDLGLAWSYNLESTRGVEATPLVVDGIMYVTASWSVVHAIDVRTGKKIWSFDPKVDKSKGFKGCCDVVNRGVALYQGKVFVGAYDGRLIALDAATGQPVWEKDTIVDHSKSYTITGAPRVFKGKVIIGNGGAEYGVRGYVTAYDADTGEQKWRWFTVPGDPSKPFEDASMAKAAKTWDPSGKYWEAGGGGTAWDTLAFDPELNLMYVGTGNGSPWARSKRSPKGGDNLYLSSIVALNPDTGKYVWHYQETPGDNWDYTATQPMILADLKIDGKPRKVILHAPKNGFFFVIDRTNGKFISAKNFVEVNWATGYDKNGRPIEIAAARQNEKPGDSIPGPFGAHNWHSMSFNPQTGLVYLPAQNIPLNLMDDKDWKFNENAPARPHAALGWNTAHVHQRRAAQEQAHGPPGRLGPGGAEGSLGRGARLAVERRHADHRRQPGVPGHGRRSPRRLQREDRREAVGDATGTGVVAAPATYMVDGKQYVSIAVGWGGVYGLAARATERQGPGTVYTFVVGGNAPKPEFVQYRMDKLVQGVKYDPAKVPDGTLLYVSNCVFCHGVPGVDRGGNIPNLGYMNASCIENLDKSVFKGPAMERGMPDFSGKLQRRGRGEDQGLHPGDGGRGPAEAVAARGLRM